MDSTGIAADTQLEGMSVKDLFEENVSLKKAVDFVQHALEDKHSIPMINDRPIGYSDSETPGLDGSP